MKRLNKIHKQLIMIIFMTACIVTSTFGQHAKKIVIYQLLPRYFGNKKTANIPYGTIAQNGSGKFNDITNRALDGLKALHVNYIWYTGVLAHASLTDYSNYGIKPDDADVVKGRAGSPYAIRDYYDVDPDLAINVDNRMIEFEALIKRTHTKGIKVLIDFVPNHVARSYYSKAKPKNVVDFGSNDDKTIAFSTQNDFYYIPNEPFQVPENINELNSPLKKLMDGKFTEFPAKATGNTVFSASPSANDWYETVKLNYGIEYRNGKEIAHFNPVPPVWIKMRDILTFWAKKGVDGFRCDVAEMVPVEFWEWVIPQVKIIKPELIFMAEAYNPKAYRQYLTQGKFDYLYDKVGLYDGLKRLIKNEPNADVNDISKVWKVESAGFGDKMVRFIENHDEERVASKAFAGKAEFSFPAMVVAATLGTGPVMLYFGQEHGEPAGISEGFIGDDLQNGRTTIFDYWGVPNHQKWMNNGAFDGKQLSENQKSIRNFYQKLLQITAQSEAIVKGEIVEVSSVKMNTKMYAYIRYTANQRLLIIANFDRHKAITTDLIIPKEILSIKQSRLTEDLLTNKKIEGATKHKIPVNVLPASAQIIQF
ncbi:alpha-amylase family protein [Pedobacter sp. Du54]|uniref:alpha-amylase family protein n=1 Tax=Pedobacter anseongensis TaxID=3133439 RepID=UPI0030B260A5